MNSENNVLSFDSARSTEDILLIKTIIQTNPDVSSVYIICHYSQLLVQEFKIQDISHIMECLQLAKKLKRIHVILKGYNENAIDEFYLTLTTLHITHKLMYEQIQKTLCENISIVDIKLNQLSWIGMDKFVDRNKKISKNVTDCIIYVLIINKFKKETHKPISSCPRDVIMIILKDLWNSRYESKIWMKF